jgi:hypothetical protein
LRWYLTTSSSKARLSPRLRLLDPAAGRSPCRSFGPV